MATMISNVIAMSFIFNYYVVKDRQEPHYLKYASRHGRKVKKQRGYLTCTLHR